MESDPLNVSATGDRIHALAREGLIDPRTHTRSLELAGVIPGRQAWQRFLDIGFLVIAAAFLISGVVFFFAYNWADMHRFLKFGLVGVLMFALVVFVSYRKLDDLPAKIALTGAAFLVGVLLAVISQGYQTGGADPYRLFLGWAALIAGWAIVGRFTPLWFLLVLLLNLGATLFLEQVWTGHYIVMEVVLFCINGVSLLLWEFGRRRGVEWLISRWTPRIFALAASAVLVLSTMQFLDEISWGLETDLLMIAPVLFVVYTGSILYYYARREPDLFILTVGGFSIVAVITSFLIINVEILDAFEAGGLLIIGLAIVLQAGLAVRILRRVEASWSDRK